MTWRDHQGMPLRALYSGWLSKRWRWDRCRCVDDIRQAALASGMVTLGVPVA